MNNVIEAAKRLIADIRMQVHARVGGEISLNDREKTGLVIGAALILLAIWLGLNAWTGKIEHRYYETQFNFGRLKAQVESGSWSDRKTQAHQLRGVLEDRLWTAETPGLAEAGFERWIRDRLTRNKIDVQQIQVRRVPLVHASDTDTGNDPLANLQRMTAKIFMPFSEPALLDLLAEIAQSNKVIVIDRITVRAGRNARVEMDVSTFFRHQERTH